MERRWALYRRSVVERMPDSDYKQVALAGIAHNLMMLDRIEDSAEVSGLTSFIDPSDGYPTDDDA